MEILCVGTQFPKFVEVVTTIAPLEPFA